MDDDQVDLEQLLVRVLAGEIRLEDIMNNDDLIDLGDDEDGMMLEGPSYSSSLSSSEEENGADTAFRFCAKASDHLALENDQRTTYGQVHELYVGMSEEQAKNEFIWQLMQLDKLEALVWIMSAGSVPASLAQSFNVGSSQCSVKWSSHDVNYHCATCQMDPTCALCTDCWVPELHQGHDFQVSGTGGGVCDCGDVTAWNADTFCPRHRRRPAAKLPAQFSARVRDLLARIHRHAHFDRCASRVFRFFGALVDLFQDPMRQLLAESLPLNEYGVQYGQNAAFSSLLFQLIPFDPFRLQMGQFLVANYGDTVTNRSLHQLSVQVLTNPNVAISLVTQHSALEIILQCGADCITPTALTSGRIPDEFYLVCVDIRYLLRHADVWPYVQAHPEALISFLSKFQYAVLLTRKTGEHELYDSVQARAADSVIWAWNSAILFLQVVEEMCQSYKQLNAALLEALSPMKVLQNASVYFCLPLHRMLARTLVECPLSCVSLEHGEAPLRFLVFLSSYDPGGLWKRNGATSATLAFYYTSPSYCQMTIDRDIFLVQCVASQVETAAFISKLRAMMDAVEAPPLCLFTTLLLIVLDRSLSGPGSPEQKAKRMIIHALAQGPAQFNQIKERLPPSVTDAPQFEAWLHEVSDFSSPTFSLKDSLWQETCIPHHSHYGATARQEAQINYNEYMERSRQIPQGLKVPPPSPLTLPSILPKYSGLLHLLESEDLWRLAIENLGDDDESLVTLCLQWLSLCAQHKNQSFVHFALGGLVDQLYTMTKNSSKLYHHSSAGRVLGHLSRADVVANKLSELSAAASLSSKEETPAERRARMKAKMLERQAKMKAAMLAKTQAFMEHHNIESLDDIEDNQGVEGGEETADECVLCHMSESTELNPICSIALLVHTNVLSAPESGLKRRKRDAGPDPSLHPSDADTLETLLQKGRGIVAYDLTIGVESAHLVIRRCGHTIHRECHQEYVTSIVRDARQARQRGLDTTTNEYVCPMCRCVNNTVIPHVHDENTKNPQVSLDVNDGWEPPDKPDCTPSQDYAILSSQIESMLFSYPLPCPSFVLPRVICASVATSLLCSPSSFVARGYRAASRLCAQLCPYSPRTASALLKGIVPEETDAFALLTRLVMCFWNADSIPLGSIYARCLNIASCQNRLESFHRRVACLLDALELPQMVKAKLVVDVPAPSLFIDLPNMFQEKQWYLPKIQSQCEVCSSVPRKPALCLLCGQVVCALDQCCANGDRGEATLHLEAEHGGIGIFLMLRDSSVFVLYKGVHGRGYPSFYLDKHGQESGSRSRSGAPLYLNKEKYDALQTIYVENRLINLCVDSEQYLRLPSWRSF